MTRVIISLGSCERQSVHIQWASERLSALLGEGLTLSRRLWTPDSKGSGKWYMNRLVAGKTALSLEALTKELKEWEQACDRSKERVTIDIDLLQYGDKRYHLSDWSRPYVTELMEKWE